MSIELRKPIQHIMYCVRCKSGIEDRAAFVYHGDSLCVKHYNEVRNCEAKMDNKTIGYQP